MNVSGYLGIVMSSCPLGSNDPKTSNKSSLPDLLSPKSSRLAKSKSFASFMEEKQSKKRGRERERERNPFCDGERG